MAYSPIYKQAYGPYGSGAVTPPPGGTITPGGTIGTPGILLLQTTGMANSIRSLATVTGSLPVEAALVKDANGAAISAPTYADCTYDSASGKWICDTPAPDGAYPAGAQVMRLKGSSPPISTTSGAATVGAGAVPFSTLSMNVEGDSLSAPRQSGGEWFNLTHTAVSQNAAYINWNNYAYPGDGIGNTMDSAGQKAAVLAGKVTVTGTGNVLFIHAGINDLQGGATAAATFALLKSLHNYYQGQGYITAATTLTTSRVAGSGYDHLEFWQRIQMLNNLTRSAFNDGTLGARVLLDLQTDPAIGKYGSPLDTTYFLADQIHYTDGTAGGNGRVSAFATRALPFLLAGTKRVIDYTGDTATATLLAIDTTGNGSGNGTTPPPQPKSYAPVGSVINNQSTAFVDYPSGWSYDNNPSYLDGSHGGTGGSTAQPVKVYFTSDGGAIEIYAPTLDGTGIVTLKLDGNAFDTFAFGASSAVGSARLTYKSREIPAGNHILSYGTQSAAPVFFDTIKNRPASESVYAPAAALIDQSTAFSAFRDVYGGWSGPDFNSIYYTGVGGTLQPGNRLDLRFAHAGGPVKVYTPRLESNLGILTARINGVVIGTVNQSAGQGNGVASALVITSPSIPAGNHVFTWSNESNLVVFVDTFQGT